MLHLWCPTTDHLRCYGDLFGWTGDYFGDITPQLDVRHYPTRYVGALGWLRLFTVPVPLTRLVVTALVTLLLPRLIPVVGYVDLRLLDPTLLVLPALVTTHVPDHLTYLVPRLPTLHCWTDAFNLTRSFTVVLYTRSRYVGGWVTFVDLPDSTVDLFPVAI